tara:strand:- start:25591 stop:25842 length:252 start_codon:yes stop_codon:yes gene_type:complete
MFESLDKTFKSRIVIGSCVLAFGVFVYKTHPYGSYANDWGYFPNIKWLPASMRSTDIDETGASETGASETGASKTDDTDATID